MQCELGIKTLCWMFWCTSVSVYSKTAAKACFLRFSPLLTTVVFIGTTRAVLDSIAVGGGREAGSVGTEEPNATLTGWGTQQQSYTLILAVHNYCPLLLCTIIVGNSAQETHRSKTHRLTACFRLDQTCKGPKWPVHVCDCLCMCVTNHSDWGFRLSRPDSRHRRRRPSDGGCSGPCDTGNCWPHTYGGPLWVQHREQLYMRKCNGKIVN